MSTPVPEELRSLSHFLSIGDIEPDVLRALIDFCIRRKGEFKRGELKPMLQGKVLAMIFQKSSLRTRLGFEAAMAQLGGHAANLEDHQVGVTKREDVKDVARVVSSMCDGIMARVYAHQLLIELAANSSVPVINGLSDWSHPCQALCDAMTIQEHFGDLAGRKLAYVGDGNNVARSLLNVCSQLGIAFAIASPDGYRLEDGVVDPAASWAERSGVTIAMTDSSAEAVVDADVVYTDVWTSMGQDAERAEREKAFLEACDHWQFPIFLTLGLTGMRPAEAVHLLLPDDVDLRAGHIRVRNKPDLGWRTKTRNERDIPICPELSTVLRRTINGRETGPLFVRRRFGNGQDHPILENDDGKGLEAELARRVEAQRTAAPHQWTRLDEARVARAVWRDAGGIKPSRLRVAFMRVTAKIGMPDLTCPKMLRHLFATCLQDANVDPLIRQELMGHTRSSRNGNGLGMTTAYTHTRDETRRSQFEAAMAKRGAAIEVARGWLARA